MPAGAVVDVLRAYGGPLYATSANPSGRLAPRALDAVDPDLVGAVDAVVVGEAGSGEASAVVDFSGEEVRVLRTTEELTGETLRKMGRGLSH